MSNKEKVMVEKIRAQYSVREMSKLDELKALDKRVKRPADVFAYIFGSIGALVLGSGMCLAMPEVIEGYMPLGICVGIVGIAMVSLNYFIHKGLISKRKKKYASRVFELSGEILGSEI